MNCTLPAKELLKWLHDSTMYIHSGCERTSDKYEGRHGEIDGVIQNPADEDFDHTDTVLVHA